jgi:SAM-dependent methyltransferase
MTLDLLGLALLDQHRDSDKDFKLLYIRDADGFAAEYAMRDWFEFGAFPILEENALKRCSGRVLDVGAGVGRHILALQAGGFEACAIDVLEPAVRIMRERGVDNAHCLDILDESLYVPVDAAAGTSTNATSTYRRLNVDRIRSLAPSLADFLRSAQSSDAGGYFNTIVMLSDTIGMVGTLAGLTDLLRKLTAWLATSGDARVLLDCSDIDVALQLDSGRHHAYAESVRADTYVGEMTMHFEYNGAVGSSFRWLYVSFDKLNTMANECG